MPKKTKGVLAAFVLTISLLVTSDASACSFMQKSMLEKYTENSTIFLGTVLKAVETEKDTYALHVDEAFKFPNHPKIGLLGDLPEAERTVNVAFNIKGQCGFDPLKAGDKVLVFMNAGDVVSRPSGSWVLWSENAQEKASLNPVWKDILTLRSMLNHVSVPDAETAVHVALGALIPTFGQEAVSQHMPLKASLDANASPVPVWRVEGAAQCSGKPPCHAGVYTVTINKFSGVVERVIIK